MLDSSYLHTVDLKWCSFRRQIVVHIANSSVGSVYVYIIYICHSAN